MRCAHLLALALAATLVAPRAAADRPFAKERPTVVVLLHGMTDNPTRDGYAGKPILARYYWGFHFVAGLLGVPDGEPLWTYAGARLTRTNWMKAGLGDKPLELLLAPGRVTVTDGVVPDPPPLSVMLTYRDGSRPLAEQAAAVAEQVSRIHRAAYPASAAPQIVLLGHSMGGLAARYLLGGPDAKDAQLTAARRADATYIRDRTLFLICLSVPHEGSLVAGEAQKVYTYLNEKRPAVVGTLLDLARQTGSGRVILGHLGAATNPAVEQIKPAFLTTLNLGVLQPARMRRSDRSLIPVYALGGRTPGGRALSTPNLGSVYQRVGKLPRRRRSEVVGLVATDHILFDVLGRAWGSALGEDPRLDWVRRTYPFGGLSGPGQRTTAKLVPPVYLTHRHWARGWGLGYRLIRKPIPTGDHSYGADDRTGDREIDTDGLVSIGSALGMRLGTDQPEYFAHDRRWPVPGYTGRVRGSWYRVYSGPWNWLNHGAMVHSRATGTWLREHLLPAAGPYVAAAVRSVWPRPKD